MADANSKTQTTNCFVIIGYGKKTSYINGKVRVLDLDETYNILIKPVFDALNIPCYRAIDKNVNGSIDKLMLKEIKNAQIAVADISTLNANVMWELGVRHALQPQYTIMMCEKEQMSAIPFDINSFVIHQYTHSEEGIPYKEVERFRKYLSEAVTKILAQDPPVLDSPVFTFLEEELLDKKAAMDAALIAREAGLGTDSFATIMEKAEKAKNEKDFTTALELLGTAKTLAASNMTLKDSLSLIICRQALCTYKSKVPSELEALQRAKIILEELQPAQSQDIEVLGLSGAINKRICEVTKDTTFLDSSLQSYEKGFQLKRDYYNGINAAFMLYRKASLVRNEGGEWEDIKLKADYIRNSVLEVALPLEKDSDFLSSRDAVWVLYTIAEGYNYKKNEGKMMEYETKADTLAAQLGDDFAPGAYKEQKEKIAEMLKSLNS